MAQKAITGLQQMPNGIWKIDKNIEENEFKRVLALVTAPKQSNT